MAKSKPPRPSKHSSQPYPPRKPLTQNPPTNTRPTPPTIPFEPGHRILLVGEGDFSFAHSLLSHHACTTLLATTLDARTTVAEKYPQAAAHIGGLEAAEGITVMCGVDATRLGKAGKEVRKGGFDRVGFNFPHVGGLTRDINRQVRYNQELLVGFFKSAIPLLAPGGSIVLTLFEGEPYELWNVRDLARHVGLKVGRSFKFQADAYPGYKHARTMGNITGGGGWKGENRAARTYVFLLKDEEDLEITRKKRKRDDSEDDDDDDDD